MPVANRLYLARAEAIVARAHALVRAHAKPRKKVFRIPLPPVVAPL